MGWPSIQDAARLVRAASRCDLQIARSLLGDPESRTLAHCPWSEWALLDADTWTRRAELLAHLAIPAPPGRLPGWLRQRAPLKPAARWLHRPARVYRYRPGQPLPDPSPDQSWFYLNGLGTERHLLMHHAAALTACFGRPLTLLHHPSRGLLPDLFETCLDRSGRGVAQAAGMAFAPLYSALKQPGCRRVVLITHSQGGAVAGVLLWLLRGLYPPTADDLLEGKPHCPEQRVARALAARWHVAAALSASRAPRMRGPVRPLLTHEELAKLEVYAFGHCASPLQPIDHARRLPYLESYGNEFDVLARLGVLAPPPPGPGGYRTGGERFVRRGAWGHLLNAHYLWPMEQEWRLSQRAERLDGHSIWRPLPGNTTRRPRLLDYFGGASPPARIDSAHEVAPPRVEAPPPRADAAARRAG